MEERFKPQGNLVVLDLQTGLMWQRGVSPEPVVWKEGLEYVGELNKAKFAGFDDWRYPTKEELASLILSEENRQNGLFLDPVFTTQRNLWSSTEADRHRACYVDFHYGDLYLVEENYANYYIRAVRTPK